MAEARLYAVGDVHGDPERVRELLEAAGLIAPRGRWSGGESELVFTGDLTDRGPDGLGAIELVRRLEEESGGRVQALMGNHDALIVARALEWRGETADPDCRDLFILNGGREREARALSEDEETLAWLRARPALAKVGDTLFQHADTTRFYRDLALEGGVQAANAALARRMETAPGVWSVFYGMTDGREWDARGLRLPGATERAFEQHLERFGAARVVHGHTRHTGARPVVSFGDRAVNIDGSLSVGYRTTPSRGFVADLGPLSGG